MRLVPDVSAQTIIVISGIADLFLGLCKVWAGMWTSSQALVADGIHSLSDLATDVMIWIFNRIGKQAPDEEHPYGHARFETFGTMLMGGILILVAGLLIHDSVMRLIDMESQEMPTWPALLVAGFSVLTKEWLYHASRIIGERTRSNLLVANAWHHRTDALSSILVIVGVGGSLLGMQWLEMVATIGVAMLIARIGWQLGQQSAEELVDTAMSKADVDQMRSQIISVDGVRGVHSLRTRRMGADVVLDIHIQVSPDISVSEGHHIGEWVTRGLIDQFERVHDVTFHIDAEDDLDHEARDSPTPMAPLRNEVRQRLTDAWNDVPDSQKINNITLHYLDDGINVEVFLAKEILLDDSHDDERFRDQLVNAGCDLHWIKKISVWYG